MSEILSVRNLTVDAGGKRVFESLNLAVERGEVLFLLGPNGVGKTSLLRALIGYPGYEIVSGSIVFEGEDITRKPMEYRVSRGLGMAHQIPPRITGLRVRFLLEKMCKKSECNVDEIASLLEIRYLLDREFGKNFSGGELKRVEIATLIAQKPRLALVDEPDSGVDIESIEIIARGVKSLIDLSPHRSVFIVTHSALISRYVEPSRVCIMLSNREIVCGDREFLEKVFEYGFREVARQGR
ncbi:MAG: ATP-binding cassette domain-containing protein [Sulfolobales archaeon]